MSDKFKKKQKKKQREKQNIPYCLTSSKIKPKKEKQNNHIRRNIGKNQTPANITFLAWYKHFNMF